MLGLYVQKYQPYSTQKPLLSVVILAQGQTEQLICKDVVYSISRTNSLARIQSSCILFVTFV